MELTLCKIHLKNLSTHKIIFESYQSTTPTKKGVVVDWTTFGSRIKPKGSRPDHRPCKINCTCLLGSSKTGEYKNSG